MQCHALLFIIATDLPERKVLHCLMHGFQTAGFCCPCTGKKGSMNDRRRCSPLRNQAVIKSLDIVKPVEKDFKLTVRHRDQHRIGRRRETKDAVLKEVSMYRC